jgi:hypothetical protein
LCGKVLAWSERERYRAQREADARAEAGGGRLSGGACRVGWGAISAAALLTIAMILRRTRCHPLTMQLSHNAPFQKVNARKLLIFQIKFARVSGASGQKCAGIWLSSNLRLYLKGFCEREIRAKTRKNCAKYA